MSPNFDCSMKVVRILITFAMPLIFSPLALVKRFLCKEGRVRISQSPQPSTPAELVSYSVPLIYDQDLLLNISNFILNLTDAKTSPLEKIIFSTRNRMRKKMHRGDIIIDIPGFKHTIMTPFIVKPEVVKTKNFVGRVCPNASC